MVVKHFFKIFIKRYMNKNTELLKVELSEFKQ